MNILVTGCNGQLGTEIRNRARGGDYFFTDVEELDITNEQAVDAYVSEKQINVIVNCAAYTNVDKAEKDSERAMAINCDAVSILASVAHKYDATVIHISTDYIFDGRGGAQWGERPCKPYIPTQSNSMRPKTEYGISKLLGEKELLHSKCKSIIIRTSWLYSPYGNNFVKTMMNLTREKDELRVVVDQIGTPTYAGDLAEFIIKIISENLSKIIGRSHMFHYTNQGVCSWYDFAIAIRDIAGNQCTILPCSTEDYPTPAPRPLYSVLDKSNTESFFKVRIPYWRDSLKECMSKM